MARQAAGDRDHACQMVQSGFSFGKNITTVVHECRAVRCVYEKEATCLREDRGVMK